MTERRATSLTAQPTPCGRRFAEELLSGYLDRALTQADEQRVRLHLEDCAVCRTQVEELSKLREVTMGTRFVEPADEQWDERPRGVLSRLSRGAGWLVAVVWLVAVTGFTLWEVATSPEGWFEKSLFFGGATALVLLFVSVLVDRLRSMRTDRYRGVDK